MRLRALEKGRLHNGRRHDSYRLAVLKRAQVKVAPRLLKVPNDAGHFVLAYANAWVQVRAHPINGKRGHSGNVSGEKSAVLHKPIMGGNLDRLCGRCRVERFTSFRHRQARHQSLNRLRFPNRALALALQVTAVRCLVQRWEC